MVTKIRAAVLALLSLLVGMGWIPEDVRNIVEQNADAVTAGIMGLWAIFAGLRAWKDGSNAS